MTAAVGVRVALVESDSLPGHRYRVELPAGPDVRPWCECPAFRYRSGGEDAQGRPSCKHIRRATSRRVLWDATATSGCCPNCGAPVQR